MTKNQAQKLFKWLAIVAISLIVTYLIFTGIATAAYYNKVLPNTYLLGKNFSGANYEEIEEYFEENPPFVSGTVNFKFEDDTKNATPEELGINVNIDESIKAAINQNKIHGTQIVTPRGLTSLLCQKIRLKPSFNIDNDVFTVKIKDMFGEKEKDPVNATIAVEDGNVVVKAEESGVRVDADAAREELLSYLPEGRIPVIDVELKEIEADVSAAELEESKEYLAENISGPISFVNGGYEVANADLATIVGWLNQDALRNQEIEINEDALNSWLNDNIVAEVTVESQPKKVSSTDENNVIDPGQEGITVNTNTLLSDTVEIVNNNPSSRTVTIVTETVEPEIQRVAPGYTTGRYPGKYIEIDLAKQMLYQLEGDNLVGSYSVSTGKWSMPTPTGEYAITNKTERAYSARYDLYMPYWMGFIGSEYGIHELPEWADGTKEGESHLGTPVSHGCVRLGVGAAGAVYGWADVGTPVIIH